MMIALAFARFLVTFLAGGAGPWLALGQIVYTDLYKFAITPLFGSQRPSNALWNLL